MGAALAGECVILRDDGSAYEVNVCNTQFDMT
jgi:hypothetical protein